MYILQQKFAFFLILLISLISLPAIAEESEYKKVLASKNNKWIIMKANPNSRNVCYGILYNSKRTGNFLKKTKQPHIMVHYVPKKSSRIAIYLGYNLLEGSEVNLSIDGAQFALGAYNDFAISDNFKTDSTIIEAMKNADRMLVRGSVGPSTYSIDTYIIKGFDDVYQDIKKACKS